MKIFTDNHQQPQRAPSLAYTQGYEEGALDKAIGRRPHYSCPENPHYRRGYDAAYNGDTTMTKTTARIFEDVDGYYVCDDAADCLDARGHAYPDKASAYMAADRRGYTHAVGSGTYQPEPHRIPTRYRDLG